MVVRQEKLLLCVSANRVPVLHLQGPSVSAYVTYYREEDAYKAIQAVNNAFIDGRHLK